LGPMGLAALGSWGCRGGHSGAWAQCPTAASSRHKQHHHTAAAAAATASVTASTTASASNTPAPAPAAVASLVSRVVAVPDVGACRTSLRLTHKPAPNAEACAAEPGARRRAALTTRGRKASSDRRDSQRMLRAGVAPNSASKLPWRLQITRVDRNQRQSHPS
jgi:hypothetical protein